MRITLTEYAQRVGVTPEMARNWARNGRIETVRSGKIYLVEEDTPRPRSTRHDPKNVIYPRTCKDCGATFDGGPKALYCPPCREKRQAQWQREARERRKAQAEKSEKK